MKEHGYIQIEWSRDILIVTPRGPLNIEGASKAIKVYQESILSSGLSSWLQLGIWDDNALGGPEVMELLPNIFQWSNEHGCRASAVVTSNNVQERIIKDMGLASFQTFKDKDQAMDWLEQQRG